jgi:multidrug efflux pump subunit AcrB
MALAVTFAMVAAYLLSRTLVPALCALWMRGHAPRGEAHLGHDYGDRNEHELLKGRNRLAEAFEHWESLIDHAIKAYVRFLGFVMRYRLAIVVGGFVLLVVVVAGVGSQLRREFFPEVDGGAFEIYVRGRAGTRIEETEKRIAEVEQVVKSTIGKDLQIVISEIGVVADWSAAYTPNSGPMDSVVKIQLGQERERSAQDYVALLRDKFAGDAKFEGLEFAYDAGGMIRGAMNEGKSTPINIQITSKDAKNLSKAYRIADEMMGQIKQIAGVVDARILQRLDYPEYIVDVDQAKAASLGLSQTDVMRNLVAALNSSIQFNKRNFWIDPVSHNQYYVGVQYPEEEIKSIDTILDVPITSLVQKRSIPLGNMATIRRANVPAELTHTNLQLTIDLTMGVQGRDLGHVADDVAAVVAKYGKAQSDGTWRAYDPTGSEQKQRLVGSRIRLSGEYSRMQDTFRNLGIGLVLASLLIYFLMVALFRSWLIPLVILTAVPFGLIGVVAMLYLTGTALNVQSLLGIIFMVGIVVSNTVLLVDHAQHLRRVEKLGPTEAIVKAASVRIRPVVMTALAAFFALLPMALGLARGSEANTPLGRAVIGGLLAGLVTTLIVVPSLFSLVVRDATSHGDPEDVIPGETAHA